MVTGLWAILEAALSGSTMVVQVHLATRANCFCLGPPWWYKSTWLLGQVIPVEIKVEIAGFLHMCRWTWWLRLMVPLLRHSTSLRDVHALAAHRASSCVCPALCCSLWPCCSVGCSSFTLNVTLMMMGGFFVNGPYALITTAVSADLGTHESVQVGWVHQPHLSFWSLLPLAPKSRTSAGWAWSCEHASALRGEGMKP